MAALRGLGLVALCALTVACSAPAPTTTDAAPSVSASPSTGAPFPALPTAALPAAQAAAMDAEMTRWVDTGLLSGVTVAVVTQAGTWSGAAGVDGAGTTLVPDSAMAIASITKTFVAAEVMHLVEDGSVDLDAPAATYFEHPQTANGVTVRQLLSMRSGVVDPPDAAYAVLGTHPDRHWDPQDALALHTN